MTRTQVWHPGQGWRRSRYTAAEEAWIARTLAAKADDRRPAYRTVRNRWGNLTASWHAEVHHVGRGLLGATATIPPPQQSGERTRGATGPSDPTGAVLSSTWAAVDRAADRLAHLTGPCLADGTVSHERCCGTVEQPRCKGHTHLCPETSAVRLCELLSIDRPHTETVDALLGTPPSSPRFALAVHHAVLWHKLAIVDCDTMFAHWWDQGAEPHELEAAVHLAGEVERGVKGLAGSLAGWSGRQERKCRAGCGAAVADPGPAVRQSRGRRCGRCQRAASRANHSDAEAS